MDILFLVVLPLATILIAIVLQKVLKNPILVAISIFAVYFVLAFTAFTADFLINAIIYTILAYLTAVIVKAICCLHRKIDCSTGDSDAILNEKNALSEDAVALQERMINLEKSIDSLESNIDHLTQIIVNAIGNHGRGNCR